jgi:basic amino acid/polyamine antiporter, APA family
MARETSTEATAVHGGGQFYTRQATGLVREMSVRDMFIITVVYISVIFGLITLSIIPFAFPGASMSGSILISGLFALFPVLLYAFFAASMPRTGGDFIYVGRVLHPALGFMANWNMTLWVVFFQAIQGGWIVGTGFSGLFYALGVSAHDQTLVNWGADLQHPWPRFIGSMIVLALIGFILSRGYRALMRTSIVLFVLMLIGLAVAIITSFATSSTDLNASFRKAGTNTSALLAAAQHGGYPAHAGISFVATLASLPLIWAVIGFSQVPAYAAGEMRSPRRNALVSMTSSVVFCVLVFALTAFAITRFAPENVVGSLEYLYQNALKAWPYPVEPTVYFYPTITHGPVIAVFIWSAFLIGGFLTIPASLLVVTRNVFAWSFDRVLPTSLSTVDSKYHAPQRSIVLVVIVVAICSAIFIFGPASFTLFAFSGSAGQMLTFIFVAVAGIVFAWRRPDLHDSSPYHRRIAGVSVFTWLGVISLAMFGCYFYLFMTNGALGANKPVGIWAIVIIMVSGGLIFGASYVINKRRGLDLLLGQRELPPE